MNYPNLHSKIILLKNMNTILNWNPYDPNILKKLHKLIFNDIYEWAVQYRNVNMTKGNSNFANYQDIEKDNKQFFENIKVDNINNILKMYLEINKLHHFREGNGRVGRIWLNLALTKSFNKQIDFSKIDQENYMHAMKESTISSQADQIIFALLKPEIINFDKQLYKEVFMKNLDASYYYENLDHYKSEDLYKQYLKEKHKQDKVKEYIRER